MSAEPEVAGLRAVGSDPAEWEGTHIRFAFDGDHEGKTHRWEVGSKRGGLLGVVKWFGRWRKYSFFPAEGCVFEEVCMREISQFIVDRTSEHRTGV